MWCRKCRPSIRHILFRAVEAEIEEAMAKGGFPRGHPMWSPKCGPIYYAIDKGPEPDKSARLLNFEKLEK